MIGLYRRDLTALRSVFMDESGLSSVGFISGSISSNLTTGGDSSSAPDGCDATQTTFLMTHINLTGDLASDFGKDETNVGFWGALIYNDEAYL